MKRIPTEEVKNRSRALTQLFKSYRPYDHKVNLLVLLKLFSFQLAIVEILPVTVSHSDVNVFLNSQLGQRQRIVVTEVSHDGNHFVGHNKFYDQVCPFDCHSYSIYNSRKGKVDYITLSLIGLGT